MIKVEQVTKKFDEKSALNGVGCSIEKGRIYGLVGSNGAGKSTLMRLISGIYKPDTGSITLEGERVFENQTVKQRLVFVPDELYFLPQCKLPRMADFYASCYRGFDYSRFHSLVKLFGLDLKSHIHNFSKGMKRQAAIILALCCSTEYILFDETFDGLDPVMRNLARKILYSDLCEKNLTVVITSHSLRELEDTCDRLALMHQGEILLESDLSEIKSSLFKIQVAFSFPYDQSIFKDIPVSGFSKNGSVAKFTVQGDKDAIEEKIKALSPLLFEAVPLTLEEVFIHQMEAKGYSVPDILPEKEGVLQ